MTKCNLPHDEDSTIALSPEEIQIFLEASAATEKVESTFKEADVEAMEWSMEPCAGTLLVSGQTKLSADK